MVTHRVHQLDHRRVALARMSAQHLHDSHAGAVVADREGERALQSVPHERIRREAPVGHEIGNPQRLAVLDDPRRETLAPTGRIGRLLLCEGERNARRASPDVPADQLVGGRERPQGRHVPIETPSESREEPLGRRFVDRGIGEDLEELAGQLRPALQRALVTGAEDADDHPAGERVVEDAHDQLGVHVRSVGPPQAGVQPAPDEVAGPGCDVGPEVVAHGRGDRLGHEVDDRPADERAARPAQQRLGRRVHVADHALLVGRHDRVAQPVEHRPHARHGPRRLAHRRGRGRRRRRGCRGHRRRCRLFLRSPLGTGTLGARRRRSIHGLGQHQREPHRLARLVAVHLDAPGVGQRAHDVEAAPVRCVRCRFLGRRVPGGTVADLDAHAPAVGGDVHRHLEFGRGVPHGIGGELREHQDERVDVLPVAAGQLAAQEAAGLADGGHRGGEPPGGETCGGVDCARFGRGLSPGRLGPCIPVAIALPRCRNP